MWKEQHPSQSVRWPQGVRLPVIVSVHHQSEEATNDFTCYLDHVPSSAYSLLKRARLYYQRNKIELACEDLQQILALQPDFAPAKLLLKEMEK